MPFKGTSDEAPAPAPPGTPGHIGWRELHAGNLEGAFAFYSGLFGWTKGEALDMGPMGLDQTFAIDGAQSGGIMTQTPQRRGPVWLYHFNGGAVEDAMSGVQSGGGEVPKGTIQVADG